MAEGILVWRSSWRKNDDDIHSFIWQKLNEYLFHKDMGDRAVKKTDSPWLSGTSQSQWEEARERDLGK